MKKVITFGTFDLFHYGHLRMLERAASLGDKLIVGVSSDKLNFSKKDCYPLYNQDHRSSIVSAIKYVDMVFIEESLEKKLDYIKEHKGDILVMGDDWVGEFDFCKDICEVVYLSRTLDISTTQIKDQIKAIKAALG